MALKERNIYKRKDGRFEARYIKSRDENGKAKYGAVYARTYAEVKEKLRKKSVESQKPEALPGAHKSVVDTMNNYLEAIKIQIKESTYWVYRGYLDNHIAPYFGKTICARITQELMQGFVNKNLDSGLSAITVQSVFILMKKGLKGLTYANAFNVKLPRRSSDESDVLSFDEQKRLESVAKTSDDVNRIGVILCLYTGIRVGELCGLMWSDIDFNSGLLYVRRTMQRIKNKNGGTRITFLEPKTKSSRRSIPLPEFLLNLLKSHRTQTVGNYIISKNGQAIEPRNMQYRFKRLLVKAGINHGSCHMTRHSFASRALENGFDIKTLSEILGHSSPVITLKKYSHVLDAHKRKSMESMASVYN